MDFELNPLANDFAILVNDQFGPYKVKKPSGDHPCNRTILCILMHDLDSIALCV